MDDKISLGLSQNAVYISTDIYIYIICTITVYIYIYVIDTFLDYAVWKGPGYLLMRLMILSILMIQHG